MELNAFRTETLRAKQFSGKESVHLRKQLHEVKKHLNLATDSEPDQFEKAASLFDSLRKGTSLYKDDATWYLALSKLKQGKNVESIEQYIQNSSNKR